MRTFAALLLLVTLTGCLSAGTKDHMATLRGELHQATSAMEAAKVRGDQVALLAAKEIKQVKTAQLFAAANLAQDERASKVTALMALAKTIVGAATGLGGLGALAAIRKVVS